MPVLSFTSPKGGVGKTTLAATVGIALQRSGWRVLAVDLDRQNALRLNFELPEELPGFASEIDSAEDWTRLAVETPAGLRLLPFGNLSAADAVRLQSQLAQNPGMLRQRLAPFLDQRDLLVLLDMPPGPSAVNTELDPLADLHLVVLLADAMSLSLLPKLQRGDYLFAAAEQPLQIGYVLNQVEPRWQLSRDVLAFSRDVLGDALFGIVHQDEAVAEAAACQMTVLDYAPESVAAHDMTAIAERVHRILARS